MKSLQAIKQEVLKLRDGNKQPIDPDIFDLIVGLRAFGVPTQYSCAGHKEKNESFPYIDIYKDDSHISYDDYSPKMTRIKEKWIKENITAQSKLIDLLTEFYKNRKVEYKYQISLHTVIDWSWARLKCIGSDLLQNMPSETFKKELLIYQKEMRMFGNFLIEKHGI